MTPNTSDLTAPVEAPSPATQEAPSQSNKCFLKKRKALDLFSGTGSVSNRLRELGFEVVSLDFLPKHQPEIVSDLLEWDYTRYPPDIFR